MEENHLRKIVQLRPSLTYASLGTLNADLELDRNPPAVVLILTNG
jgi:hypothetical protein